MNAIRELRKGTPLSLGSSSFPPIDPSPQTQPPVTSGTGATAPPLLCGSPCLSPLPSRPPDLHI